MILAVGEHTSGKLARSAYELTEAARNIGREGPIALLILGSDVRNVAAEAALIADQVLVADLPALGQYDPEVWAGATAQIAKERGAHTVLIAGSRSGREYSPRVAVKLNAPLLEDVISLKDVGGALGATRYTFLARVAERVQAEGSIAVATIKPGAFTAAKPATSPAESHDVELELSQPRLQVTGRIMEQIERVPLADAEIVVAGGRGVGSAQGFTELVEGLANELGAAVGATRAVVDEGWRPYSEQIGQTGKSVQPKIYIALGISGAAQHLSGMNKSKLIVAINRDAEAAIFKEADYCVVSDVKLIVPALIRELKGR